MPSSLTPEQIIERLKMEVKHAFTEGFATAHGGNYKRTGHPVANALTAWEISQAKGVIDQLGGSENTDTE